MEISYVPYKGDTNERRVCPVACSNDELQVPQVLFLSDADLIKIQQCREAAKTIQALGLDIQSISSRYVPTGAFGDLHVSEEKYTFISDEAEYFRAYAWSILTFTDGNAWIQCREKYSETLVEWLILY